MNALARVQPDDFVPRHRLTVDEVMRMVEVGVLRPKQPVELIDGVLVEMASEGWLHTGVKSRLIAWLIRNAPPEIAVVPDSTLHLPPHDAPEPDTYLYPELIPLEELQGSDVILIVEVADSSLRYDTKFKPGLYGRFGVREYWVLDLVNERVVVHRGANSAGYDEVITLPADAPLRPAGYETATSLAELRAQVR